MIAASIRSYLERALALRPVEDGWELHYGDAVLATLGNPAFVREVHCVTCDGQWTFERLRGGHTEARQGSAVIARYRSRVIPGGVIELPDEMKLRLRPPATSRTWRVRRGLRVVVLTISPTEAGWKVEFGALAREIYHLPLLTMFAFHAVLTEADRPAGGGGGDGGVGF